MRTTLSLLGIALLLLCVSPASAAGPAGDGNATQDARARFRRGVQLYNEGSFEAALAEFNKAYQLNPNYRLLYNIAQTQFDLHDYVAASRYLEQYVKEGGNEIPEDRRGQVADLNRKLEERIGHVEVTCNLDGAEIRVDDIAVGVSPLPDPVPVNAGPRRITAIKPGLPTVVRLVTVPGMEKKKVILEIDTSAGEIAERSGAIAGSGKGLNADLAYQRDTDRKTGFRIALITSSALAGGCAIATGVFGVLALQAKSDFDQRLKAVPGSSDRIDDARSKMKSYALATDIFAAATLVSAGAAVYFFFADGAESGASKSSSRKRSLAIAPTVGGLVLQSGW